MVEKETKSQSAKDLIFDFWTGYGGQSTGMTIRQTAEKFGITPHTVRNYFKETGGQVFLNDDEHLCVIEGAQLQTGCGGYRDHGLVEDPDTMGSVPQTPRSGGRLIRLNGTVPLNSNTNNRE